MIRKSLRVRLLGISLAASLTGSAAATTLVRDQFSDGAVSNGADSHDVAWTVLNGSPVSLGITPYGGQDDGNGMSFNSSWAGTGSYPIIRGGAFTSQALAIGEYVTLVANFKITNAAPIPTDAAGIRIALGSSAATYTFKLGCGTAAGSGFIVNAPDLVTGTSTTLTTTGSTPMAVNSGSSQVISLRLRRVDGSTLEVSARLGTNRYVATHTGVTNFTFDRILLGTGAVNNLDLRFDNIFVVTATAPPAGARIGVAASDESSRHVENFLGKMQLAGAENMRTFPNWGGIQAVSGGPFSWGFVDSRLQLIESYGMQVSGIIAYGSSWTAPGVRDYKRFPDSDSHRAEYGAYAAAAAGRYGSRIANWEIWNEPNAADFNLGNHGADAYAKLVKACYDPMKAASPTSKVGLTVANNDVRFLKVTIERLAANGAAGKYDFLAVHPYGLATRMNGSDGQGERYFLNIVPFLRAMAGNSSLPIRFSEVGVKTLADGSSKAEGETIDETLQAELLPKIFALGLAQGVEQIHWFDARDADGSIGWGLITSAGVERKAYKAYQAVTASLGSTPTYKGWLTYGAGGKGYGFVFGGNGSDVLIAWMPKGQAQSISFPGATNVVDILTNITTPLASGASFNLTERPIIVRNLPATTVSTASSNKALPFPWGSVPVNTNLADMDFGATNVGRGITQGNPGETPHHVFSDGTDGRRMNHWGTGNEFSFNVDPRFATYGTRDIYVRVTARRITLNTTAKLRLYYEPSDGAVSSLSLPRASTAEWSLPNNSNWNTYTWHISNVLFANTFGRSMFFGAAESSVFVIGKVEISKVPF